MSRFFRRTRGAWLIVGVFAAALIGGVLSQSVPRTSLTRPTSIRWPAGFFKAVDAACHAPRTRTTR